MFGARGAIRVSLWRRSRSGAAFRSRCSDSSSGATCGTGLTGCTGRTQLVRYARAAGLDRQLVLEAMLPLVRRTTEVTTPADPAPAPQPPPVATIPAVEPPAIIVIDAAAAHEDLVDEDQPVAQVAPAPAVASPQVLPEPEESNPAERIFAGRWANPASAYRILLLALHHGRRASSIPTSRQTRLAARRWWRLPPR